MNRQVTTLKGLGNGAYTKVAKNVPPEDSQGWTIILMDRASRFIGELRCGKKDRKLFLRAINRLCDYRPHASALFLTDGKRRHGNICLRFAMNC